METLKLSTHLNRVYSGNVSCEFCPLQFGTFAEKNAHILIHFDQEMCLKCDQNLLRIGGNLYVLHGTVTCIETKIKLEPTSNEQNEPDNEILSQPYDPIDTNFNFGVKDIEKNDYDECLDELTGCINLTNVNAEHSTFVNNISNNEATNTQTTSENACGESSNIKYETIEDDEICTNKDNSDKSQQQLKQVKKQRQPKKKSDKPKTKTKKPYVRKNYICRYEGCNAVLNKSNCTYHLAKMHKTTRFECDICKKTFLTKVCIRAHILRVHDPSGKKFKCELCGSLYMSQSLLKYHHKISHLKERDFICSECGKTFCTNSELKLHSTKHTGERPLACPFEGCQKRFRFQGQRNEHLRSHTGEKPFVCTVEGCDRRFGYAVDIKRHKFSAHGIYTNKYPCQICEKIFPESILLKKHMEKH